MATESLVPPKPKSYDDTFFKPISLWLTTTDHKLIGIMYMTTGILSFVIAGVFAPIMQAPSRFRRTRTSEPICREGSKCR